MVWQQELNRDKAFLQIQSPTILLSEQAGSVGGIFSRPFQPFHEAFRKRDQRGHAGAQGKDHGAEGMWFFGVLHVFRCFSKVISPRGPQV